MRPIHGKVRLCKRDNFGLAQAVCSPLVGAFAITIQALLSERVRPRAPSHGTDTLKEVSH